MERQQVYILLGELSETAVDLIADEPLPHFAGALTVELLQVLANPLHFMYIKASEFLNKSPLWNLEKLPSYWINRILLRKPDIDDRFHKEVEWLIHILIEGLRTFSVRWLHVEVVVQADQHIGDECLQTV